MIKSCAAVLATTFAACGLAMAGPAFADVTAGVQTTDTQMPFNDGATWNFYQQLYDASLFSGPVTIDAVSFLESAGRPASTTSAGTFTLSFYLTSKTVGTISSTGADNRGTLLASFGAFDPPTDIPGSPGALTFDGADFVYDPSQGNLLLQVVVTGGTSATGGMAFDTDSTQMAAAYRSDAFNISGKETGGLVTRFTTSPAAGAAPEPAAWALMIGGLGLTGAALRRRRVAGRVVA